MRMKIVVADWSAPTLPAMISLASAARMRSSWVDVLGFGSGGGLTMRFARDRQFRRRMDVRHLQRERLGARS